MRLTARFSLAFALTAALCQFVLPDRSYLPAAVLCALLALAACLLSPRLRRLLIPGALAAALCFAWCFVYQQLFYAPAAAWVGQTRSFTGVVEDYPTPVQNGFKVSVRLETGAVPVRTLFYFYFSDGLEPAPGDTLTGTASFRSAAVSGNEEVTYYTAKGIYLVASGVSGAELQPPGRTPLWAYPAHLAHRIRTSLYDLYPPEQAAYLQALLTGNRTALTESTTTSLSRSGLSHTVAVSGMHISCLAAFLYLLTPNRRLRLLCLPVLFLFAAVAGFTPSVSRAVLMQTVFLCSSLFRRENDSLTSLSLSLLLLLLHNPFSIASISLQLSFCAVCGLLLLSQPMYQWGLRRLGRLDSIGRWKIHPLLRLLLAGVSTTLGASLFTLPLAAYYFDTISLIAPLSNLLTLWAVTLSFCGGLLSALLAPVWMPLARLIALGVSPLAAYVTTLTQWLGTLPYAALTASSFYVRLWLLHLYAMAGLIFLSPALRRRPWLPLACSAAVLAFALAAAQAPDRGAQLSVTVLDVGQGQSVFLLSKGEAAAVDCGGSGFDSPGDVLADRMQDAGCTQLDYLIFTHLHSDHANGVEELFARVPVHTVILPQVEEAAPWEEAVYRLAQAQGSEIIRLSEDASIPLGDARLTLFAPLGAGDQNEEGLSLLCSAGGFDLLLTGDMTSLVEQRLVRHGRLPRTDVLIAGHHGSRYASSPQLLEAISPSVSILSVGYNRYGHPAQETLDRLSSVSRAVYRTDVHGDVVIRVHPQT